MTRTLQPPRRAWTLNVDGTAFAFEDADSKLAAVRVWFNSGLSWSAGDSVSLTLIEPADATLSDLVLEDNAGTEITLTPTFVTGTTRYTASVASSVSAITLTPTVNDASATVEYLNASNAAITDTDTTTPALDAPLVVGANTFKVKVTAGNTTPTTETYRVVVTRAADTTAPSPESARCWLPATQSRSLRRRLGPCDGISAGGGGQCLHAHRRRC